VKVLKKETTKGGKRGKGGKGAGKRKGREYSGKETSAEEKELIEEMLHGKKKKKNVKK